MHHSLLTGRGPWAFFSLTGGLRVAFLTQVQSDSQYQALVAQVLVPAYGSLASRNTAVLHFRRTTMMMPHRKRDVEIQIL